MHNYAPVETGAEIRLGECPRRNYWHQGENKADPGQGAPPLRPVCQHVQVSPPSDTLIAREASSRTVNISLMPTNMARVCHSFNVTSRSCCTYLQTYNAPFPFNQCSSWSQSNFIEWLLPRHDWIFVATDLVCFWIKCTLTLRYQHPIVLQCFIQPHSLDRFVLQLFYFFVLLNWWWYSKLLLFYEVN